MRKIGWHAPVKDENLDLYTLTHEYGHLIENEYTRKYINNHYDIDTSIRRYRYTKVEENYRREIDKDIRDSLFNEVRKKENFNF